MQFRLQDIAVCWLSAENDLVNEQNYSTNLAMK